MKWFNSLSVVSVMALTLTACGGGGAMVAEPNL
jgi:hypothetical protein